MKHGTTYPLPPWTHQVTVITHTTNPPKWQPCGTCGGTGGSMQNVSWSLAPQWVSCLMCGGGAGVFVP